MEHVDNQPVGGHHQAPLKQAVQGQEKTSLFGEKERKKGSKLAIVIFLSNVSNLVGEESQPFSIPHSKCSTGCHKANNKQSCYLRFKTELLKLQTVYKTHTINCTKGLKGKHEKLKTKNKSSGYHTVEHIEEGWLRSLVPLRSDQQKTCIIKNKE